MIGTNVFSRISARAHQVVDRLTHKPPPVSARPAEPGNGTLGVLALSRLAPAPAEPPPYAWDRDPERGSVLPVGPAAALPTVGFVGGRALHRHGWLPARVRAGEADAWDGVTSWLRHDLPGQSLAWVHGTDVAVRLIHWHAALSWGEAPSSVRDAMAGSAAWHLRHLEATFPRPDASHRQIAHACGLIVGGFTFPELAESRGAWSSGLSRLGEVMPVLTDADGGDPDLAPAFLAQSLWLVAIARAVARAAGSALPAAADEAWLRAATHIGALAGPLGRLPAHGDAPDLPTLAFDYPLAWSIQNIATTMDQELDPAPRADEDPRCRMLGLTPSAPPPPPGKRDLKATEHYRGARAKAMPAAPPKGWAMWTWRQSGVTVAHLDTKHGPARVTVVAGAGRGAPWTHAAPMAVQFDVGGLEVLADPGSAREAEAMAGWATSAEAHGVLTAEGGELVLARVDGKKARVDGRVADGTRSVLLNQQRVVVTDKRAPGPVRLVWQLGPGWTAEKEGDGWVLTQGAAKVVVQLPDALRWSVVIGRGAQGGQVIRAGAVVNAPCFVGEGEHGGTLTSSFELR